MDQANSVATRLHALTSLHMDGDQNTIIEGMVLEAKRQGREQHEERGAVAGATLPLYLASVEELTRQNASSLSTFFQELLQKRDAASRAQEAISPDWQRPRTYPWLLLLPGVILASWMFVYRGSPLWIWLLAPAVLVTAWILWREVRASKWRVRRERAKAEAAQPQAEFDLVEQQFARALQETVLTPAFPRAVAVKWSPHGQVVSVDDDRSISTKIDPGSLVTTSASTRVALALLRKEGTAIGVAGQRGAGKTQLVQNFAQTTGKTLGVFLWAPSKVDHFSFLLHLLKRLCAEAQSAVSSDPLFMGRLYNTSRRMTLLRQAYVVLGLSTALVAIGLAIIAGAIFDFDIRDHKAVWGIGCILGGVLLIPASSYLRFANPGRIFSVRHTSRYREVEELATKYLSQAEFTESYSMNAELTARLAPIEGKVGYGRGLERRPLTDVDTVHAIASLVKVLRADNFEVVIGIDELDKIGSDEEAMAFLNAIKILFPIDGCSFITSVSENVWVRFEQRGLPFRDVFDSSFDEVVYVNMLTARQARDLLRSREPRLTDLQCLFCYTLSGGLPRELLRIARRLVQVSSIVPRRTLVDVIDRVLREDIEGKVRSTRARISQVVPAQHRSEYFQRTTLIQKAAAASGSDTSEVATPLTMSAFPSDTPGIPEWRHLAELAMAEMNVYIFSYTQSASRFERGAPSTG